MTAAAQRPEKPQRSHPGAAARRALQVVRHPTILTDGAPVWPIGVVIAHTLLDALDRAGFAVILPEVQNAFSLDLQGISSVASVTIVAGIVLSVPAALWADRGARRTTFLAVGALIAAVFSITSAAAAVVWLFVLGRAGFGFGLIVNDPAQQSLLSDYSPITARPKVFAARQIADGLGSLLGPLLFGALAVLAGWRAPLVALAVPAVVLAVASRRLREPPRGAPERAAAGLVGDDLDAEEEPLGYRDSYRTLRAIPSMRAIWYSLPFLVGGVLVLATLVPLYLEEEFGLGPGARGAVAAVGQLAGIVGLFVGAKLARQRLFADDPSAMFRFLASVGVVIGIGILWMAVAPTLVLVIVGSVLLSVLFSLVLPAYGMLSSVIMPPRARTVGFAIGRLWVLPGLVMLPVIGAIGDASGLRWGIALGMPVFCVGALLLGRGGATFAADMAAAIDSARSAVDARRAASTGELPVLLDCRGVEVRYGSVQVLFGVDLAVREGEMVGLLGTNGAGKSTLLRAISGSVGCTGGSIHLDGVDITHARPGRTTDLGSIYVPGGKGVFPSLTVAENLRAAAWLHRRDTEHVDAALNRILDRFPALAERWNTPAGNLSGGEQQMVVLGQALLAKPRLLLIDELSLGLAPTIVGTLLDLVRELHAEGVTMVLVEQSVNVALSLCDRAVFLEKGEVRYEGPTRDLLDRPDVLRSVFLGRALPETTTPEGADPPARSVGEPVLQCEGLVKRFGGIRAVNDVSFALHDGEVLGLLGANGAGKTTTFDLVSGFMALDQGRIRLEGVDITDWSPHARAWVGLGRSFQDAWLFPSLTVAEAIAVALERHLEVRDPLGSVLGSPAVREAERRARDRVEELIDALGLGAYRDAFVSELSTGTRRIVDLACALAHRPKVLLLDEPSSGIAQREAEALGPVLLTIRDELGASLLVIEHDVRLLRTVSDRLLCLESGRCIAEGSPDAVLSDPQVIASYLGDDDIATARSGAPVGGTP